MKKKESNLREWEKLQKMIFSFPKFKIDLKTGLVAKNIFE